MAMSVSERVKKRRDHLRASGFRPIQIWVPDTRRASFTQECHRQSALLSKTDEHKQLDWIETAHDDEGWA